MKKIFNWLVAKLVSLIVIAISAWYIREMQKIVDDIAATTLSKKAKKEWMRFVVSIPIVFALFILTSKHKVKMIEDRNG